MRKKNIIFLIDCKLYLNEELLLVYRLEKWSMLLSQADVEKNTTVQNIHVLLLYLHGKMNFHWFLFSGFHRKVWWTISLHWQWEH